MPEPTRQYVLSESQIRTMFLVSGILMVTVIVGILVLASAQPQGRFQALDQSQFETTLQRAAAQLDGYGELSENTVQIPIERAMELVVERGVTNPFSADAGGGPQASAAATGGAETGGAGTTPAETATAETGDADTGGAQAAAETGGSQPAAADTGGAESAQAEALPDGATVYQNCAGCHQGNGQGIAGAFPPLAGHLPEIYAVEGGRDYLIDVLLYGLQGSIEVNGSSYNGVMPAWAGSLSDAQIASVLNFSLTTWGNAEALGDGFTPYSAADIAAKRDQGLSANDVHAQREALPLP